MFSRETHDFNAFIGHNYEHVTRRLKSAYSGGGLNKQYFDFKFAAQKFDVWKLDILFESFNTSFMLYNHILISRKSLGYLW